MRVGFIGLGTMGARIAMNAIRGGDTLTVHDVNRSAAKPPMEAGASWADTPAGAATDTDVIMLSLPGPREFEAFTLGELGLLEATRAGQAILDQRMKSELRITKTKFVSFTDSV